MTHRWVTSQARNSGHLADNVLNKKLNIFYLLSSDHLKESHPGFLRAQNPKLS